LNLLFDSGSIYNKVLAKLIVINDGNAECFLFIDGNLC
jgi:hypothetical protein